MDSVFPAIVIGSLAGLVAFALFFCLYGTRKSAPALPPLPEPSPTPDPNLPLIERLQVLMRLVRDHVQEHSASVSDVDESLYKLQQDPASQPMSELADALKALLEKNAQLQSRLQTADKELTHQSELLEQQRHAALTDPLTGLANRRAFDDQLELLAEGAPLGILMLDLDHFKRINDTFGHAAGDAALIEVGAILRKNVRQDSFVARMGGEEFAVLVPSASEFVLSRVSHRLRESIAAGRAQHEGQMITVTTSVGAALQQPGEDFISLCKRADEATYASKQAGRNCCHLHNGATTQRIEIDQTEKPVPACPPPLALASRMELMAQIRRQFLESDLQASPLALVLLEIESLDPTAPGTFEIDHPCFQQVLHLSRSKLRDGDLLAESDPHQVAVLLPAATVSDSSGPVQRLNTALDNWMVEQGAGCRLRRGTAQTSADDNWVSFVRRAESQLHKTRRSESKNTDDLLCPSTIG